MPTDILEPGLTALTEGQWELGGFLFGEGSTICAAEPGDEGLDDVSEVVAEDQASGGDGSVPSFPRLAPRDITLHIGFTGTMSALADLLDAVREVCSPLPNRQGTRLLRWRREGEVAKRIEVQPAVGKPLAVPSGSARLVHGVAKDIVIRLTAPDPTILSDVVHEESFSSGATITCVNAGTFTAWHPTAWNATFPAAMTIENVDYSEAVSFSAAATVGRDRSLSAGTCSRPGGLLIPRWPLMRPGDNDIKATGGSMTFQWRDTW